MKYADMAVPSRAQHLWRYTPWARIHPSSVDQIPEALPVQWKILEGGSFLQGLELLLEATISFQHRHHE